MQRNADTACDKLRSERSAAQRIGVQRPAAHCCRVRNASFLRIVAQLRYGKAQPVRYSAWLGGGPSPIQPECDDAEGDLERCDHNLVRIRRLKFQNPCSSGQAGACER